MLFTDPGFLVVFLPTLFALYFLGVSLSGEPGGPIRFGWPNVVLLAGGVAFYGAVGGTASWVIVAATVLTCVAGFGMARARRIPAEAFLTVGIWGNVMLLVVTKYALPLPLGGQPVALPRLIAPFGLLFFACHAISYLVDVYRREAAPPASPVGAAVYLLFFPLAIAGPIVRYRAISPQLANRRVGMAAFAFGVRRFTIGLVKVRLIAQTVGAVADVAFALPARDLSAASAWLGVACFTVQVYFDLSGYADMAIGLGRMLGFRLPENFKWPYGADTLTEFWRRWNMSLFAWFRAYLALPLEDSRRGRTGTRNLLTLFLLVGLWHGPGWGALAWGCYHGALLILERGGLATMVGRLPAAVRHAYLLLIVMVGWVFLRAETMTGALLVLRAMVGLNAQLIETAPLSMTPGVWMALGVGALGSVPLLPSLSRWTVTLDAMTTSALMLVSAAVVFTWRSLVGMIKALTGQGRTSDGPAGPPRPT